MFPQQLQELLLEINLPVMGLLVGDITLHRRDMEATDREHPVPDLPAEIPKLGTLGFDPAGGAFFDQLDIGKKQVLYSAKVTYRKILRGQINFDIALLSPSFYICQLYY